ncbi:MAG: hypothetical protein OHK0022_01390 [Roseiflexaceae bacterium]
MAQRSDLARQQLDILALCPIAQRQHTQQHRFAGLLIMGAVKLAVRPAIDCGDDPVAVADRGIW